MEEKEKIDLAFDHITNELLLDQIKPSLGIDFEKSENAHDATHELMYIGGNVVENLKNYSFKTNSIYFIYNWEAFDQATRANIEAVSTYYNSAFVLLRTTIELLVKGVFYDCLAHKKFRNNASIIEQTKTGRNLKNTLDELAKKPDIDQNFENITIAIFDEIEEYLKDRKNIVSFKIMLRQIIEWGMLEGIENAESSIYGIYQKLSSDVHVSPDSIDIGRRLISNRDLFKKREIMPEYYLEFLELLHTVMDVSITVMLNMLKDPILDSEKAKEFLKNRLENEYFVSLKLARTTNRIKDLVTSK